VVSLAHFPASLNYFIIKGPKNMRYLARLGGVGLAFPKNETAKTTPIASAFKTCA
jgi:hypothetical protein